MGSYVVFSKRVALALRDRGFSWYKMEPSRKNPGYSVFVFEDSVELRAAINSINGRA